MGQTETIGALALGFLLVMINLIKYFDTRKDYKGGQETRETLVEEIIKMRADLMILAQTISDHEVNSKETRVSLNKISSKYETIIKLSEQICKK